MGNIEQISKGIIMYPGGLVNPWSYVGLLSDSGLSSYVIFICKPPSHLQVFDINAAQLIIKDYGEINEWTIMGHSLGGAMACTEVQNHPKDYENLILLAAYPAKNIELTDFQGCVLSISASEDPFSNAQEILDSQSQFNSPIEISETEDVEREDGISYFYEISGGIHSFFGDYGIQNGDGTPNISREEHQIQVMLLIKKLIL
jgi:pimeloyl-ACP methyl ester carboxylesterase